MSFMVDDEAAQASFKRIKPKFPQKNRLLGGDVHTKKSDRKASSKRDQKDR